MIGQAAELLTFDDDKVSSTETQANCPKDYIFTVTKRDGTDIDASIFTFDGAT